MTSLLLQLFIDQSWRLLRDGNTIAQRYLNHLFVLSTRLVKQGYWTQYLDDYFATWWENCKTIYHAPQKRSVTCDSDCNMVHALLFSLSTAKRAKMLNEQAATAAVESSVTLWDIGGSSRTRRRYNTLLGPLLKAPKTWHLDPTVQPSLSRDQGRDGAKVLRWRSSVNGAAVS